MVGWDGRVLTSDGVAGAVLENVGSGRLWRCMGMEREIGRRRRWAYWVMCSCVLDECQVLGEGDRERIG